MPQYVQSTEGLNKNFLALPSRGETYGSSQGLHNSRLGNVASDAPVPIHVGDLRGSLQNR